MIVKELADWKILAGRVLVRLKEYPNHDKRAQCLILSGDLGAGKTTFTQNLADSLGVKEVVQSPTFTIMKFYQTLDPVFTSLIHMDAYRIEDKSELFPLGFFELLNKPKTLICVEWGERIIDSLPKDTIILSINHQQSDIRLVTIEKRE